VDFHAGRRLCGSLPKRRELKAVDKGEVLMKDIFLDNMEEYEDPTRYDQEFGSYRDDIPMLVKWAQKSGGPVVELACGTGRVTIPIAECALPIVGVDLNEKMLQKAREKTRGRDLPVKWVKQDCSRLHLDLKSPFIFMTGNAFQHFLTNESQDQLLKSVYEHLSDYGTFIFNTRFPSRKELLQPEEESPWFSYADPRGSRVSVSTICRYDPLTQLQHYTVIRRWEKASGEQIEKRTRIMLRYTYPQEMERLLTGSGFDILETYGSWDGSPLTGRSSAMIYVCRKR